LIEPGVPVILIILEDVHLQLMVTATEEVSARGAFTIVITNSQRKMKADVLIKIPNNGMLTALLAAVPLQLLAYELALLRGIDPDRPRNLAKAVTVD